MQMMHYHDNFGGGRNWELAKNKIRHRAIVYDSSTSMILVLLTFVLIFSPAVHNGEYQEARVLRMRIAIVLSRVVGGGPSPALRECRSHPAGPFILRFPLVLSNFHCRLLLRTVLMQNCSALHVEAGVLRTTLATSRTSISAEGRRSPDHARPTPFPRARRHARTRSSAHVLPPTIPSSVICGVHGSTISTGGLRLAGAQTGGSPLPFVLLLITFGRRDHDPTSREPADLQVFSLPNRVNFLLGKSSESFLRLDSLL